LETTISGATHVIINVSGDISLADANDAATYVQDLAGDEVNIIFGAMYDETKTDTCTVTVIATGLEDTINNVMQNRLGVGNTYRQPATHITPSSLKGINLQPTLGSATVNTSTVQTGIKQPLTGIRKPGDIRSSVEEKSLKIPDFLQKK